MSTTQLVSKLVLAWYLQSSLDPAGLWTLNTSTRYSSLFLHGCWSKNWLHSYTLLSLAFMCDTTVPYVYSCMVVSLVPIHNSPAVKGGTGRPLTLTVSVCCGVGGTRGVCCVPSTGGVEPDAGCVRAPGNVGCSG